MRDTILKLRVLHCWLRSAYEQWRDEVWRHDLDSRACCDGHMCGCGGSSRRDLYTWNLTRPKTKD